MLGLLINTPVKKSPEAEYAYLSSASDYRKAPKRSNILSFIQFFSALVLLLFFKPLLSAAEEPGLNAKNTSIIKIINSRNNLCGSGILHKNLLITNAHVANTLCIKENCLSTSLVAADGREFTYAEGKIRLLKIAPVFDLAILKLQEPVFPLEDSYPRLKESQNELRSLSFPGCGELRFSDGKVLHQSSALYITTSLSLRHGSSGGAVFDKNADLYGIIAESEDISGAARSIISGQDFSATRIIPVKLLDQVLNLPEAELFDAQSKVLLDFYLSQVVKQQKISRIAEAARFLGKVRELALGSINNHSSTILLAGLSSAPYPFFASEKTVLPASSIALGLAASIEKNGLYKSVLTPLTQEESDEIRSALGPDAEIFDRISNEILSSGYKGADKEMLSLLLKAAILFIAGIIAFIVLALIIWRIRKFSAVRRLLLISASGLLITGALVFAYKLILL